MIVAGTPIERPSIREAGYLQLERGGVSHSIGWAGTLDVGNVDVDEYHAAIVEQLRRRIDVLPRLRQRPVALPRGYGLPIWVDAADFDVANHVHTATLDDRDDQG